MTDNAGPFAALRAWLSNVGRVRPAVLRPTIGPESDHNLGAVNPYTARVRTDPSAGLHLVNALAADAGRVTTGITADLVKPDQSAWARPGRHNVAFSVDRATGDDAYDAVLNNGTKTLIASRHSAPTLPRPQLPGREPFGGADWRTAPAGLLGQRTAPEYGSGGAGGDRTRFRRVPPTDAANPPPTA